MNSLLRTALAASAAVAACAAPAQAQTPTPVNTPYFFQCVGQNKVQNNGPAAPWTTTKPTASYTAGAGCGFLDQTLLVSTVGGGNTLVDAVFEGTHTGPVSAINVDLHELLLSHAESGVTGAVHFEAILEIDGVEAVNSSNVLTGAQPTPSPTGLSQSIRFGMNNLKVTDAEEHTYRLTINKYYSDTASAWVFGASEIASGIEFNPAKVAKPTLKGS